MGVGTMIGAGIFVLPSIAAANAGPASMVSFLIGGGVSLLAALSLSELATGMPRSGGSYYYVNRALGGFFGSIVGWGMWAGLMFATAFYMLGFGQYLTYFYGEMPIALAALVMACLLLVVNYRGVKEASSLQNLIVILLIGFILVFISIGIFHVEWEVLRPFNPNGWSAVAATAATIYVSFIGFEVIATSAEEIKNPGRTLPLAMIASVLTPTLLYVLVILVSTGVLPVAELAASYIPVADVAQQFLGVIGAVTMVVGAILATVSSANASILSAARVNFAMGRDRILSEWLNDVHSRYRTPYRAIVVTGLVILVLIALDAGIELLADVASFAYLTTYTCVHVAVIVMRRAAPVDYDPSFKMPGWMYPAVPFVGMVSCIVIIAQMKTFVLLVGSVIVLFGSLWYVFYASKRQIKESLIGEAIVGVEGRAAAVAGVYRVVVPVANPKTERHLLRLAAASVHLREQAELVAVNIIEVPPQTALSQGVQFEEERIQKQQELLEHARDWAHEMKIGLRTRAIVGRDVGEVVQKVIREERAQHVVIGWSGKRKRRDYILGSNIDQIIRDAPCELTLIKIGSEVVRNVLALVGTGPNAPLAVERARQFVQSTPDSHLTLLNVQAPAADRSPEEDGERLIRSVAAAVGLESDSFRTKVVVSADLKNAILEAVEGFDTICVGGTRSTSLAQALFGSIPEEIGEQADATVAIVRGASQRPRSIADAVVERLTQGT